MSRRKPIPLTAERVQMLRACPSMRVYDAIEIYGLGRNSLYRLMNEGTLPYRKLGGVTLLSTEGLEALVAPNSEHAA
jgi:predicted DNA-binding transcriptional regulator AlpA